MSKELLNDQELLNMASALEKNCRSKICSECVFFASTENGVDKYCSLETIPRNYGIAEEESIHVFFVRRGKERH